MSDNINREWALEEPPDDQDIFYEPDNPLQGPVSFHCLSKEAMDSWSSDTDDSRQIMLVSLILGECSIT